MKKVFTWLTGDVLNGIKGVLDEVITTKEEKQRLLNEIHALILTKAHELESFKSDIILSETKGNFLQRSWRPILMLSFGLIIMYNKFIAPAFQLPNADLESDFWDLLQIGVGGYIFGRSAEQITKNVKLNITKK